MENQQNQPKNNAMAIVGLVLGIIALIVSFVPCVGAWAIVPGLLGILFSVLGMRKAHGKGMAVAGLVLSIIAMFIGIWQWYALYKVADGIDKANKQIENLN